MGGGGITFLVVQSIAGLLVLAGAVVFWLTSRRPAHDDDRPHCRACRFDLSGLAISADHATQCPECGAGLLKPRAMTNGLPRRPRWLSTGLVLAFAFGALVLINAGYTFVIAPQHAPYKPSWALKLEIQYSSLNLAQSAWAEMIARKHSDATHRWLIREAIKDDISRAGRAPFTVANWLRAEWDAGRADPREVAAVLKGRAAVKLKLDPPVRVGERPVVKYELTTGVQTSFWVHEVQIGEVNATIDAKPVFSGRITGQQYQSLGSLFATIPADPIAGPPREAKLTIQVPLEFRIENPAGAATWSEVISDQTSVTVEPARPLGRGALEDTATARSIERSLSVPSVEVWFDPSARTYTPFLKLTVNLDFEPSLPVAVAADLYLRPATPGAPWKQIGTIVADHSTGPRTLSVEGMCNDQSTPEWRTIFDRTTPAAFEVLLAPNHTLAAARLNDEQYLASPIHLVEVPARPWGERRFRGYSVTFHSAGGYTMTPLPKK